MSARSEQMRDRFLGAMVGLAIGEALAAPAVGRAHYAVESEHPGGIQDLHGGGPYRAAPGELLSGATQLLECIESYAVNQEVDGFDLAFRLGSLTESDVKGFGDDERTILAHLYENPERWDSQANDYWSRSCGMVSDASPLPRCALVAAVHTDNMDLLTQDTIRLCKLTHADPRCVEAALAFNFLLLQCLKGHFSTDLPAQASGFVVNLRHSEMYSRVVLDFGELRFRSEFIASASLPYPEDVEAVSDALDSIKKAKLFDLRTTGTAASALAAAAWTLANAKDFGPGVSQLVSLGGSADRNGALAGALLGARFGLSRIPPVWLRKLTDRSRIVTLVEKLLLISSPVA
ncbi:MAG: ADP-ribosylglycohydrolase family protein [Candidatus Sumerlaeia bacterium]|nr:ADP-ribosylglycohydrolase family protein [Candidatus Sumerlaeia bacterium]